MVLSPTAHMRGFRDDLHVRVGFYFSGDDLEEVYFVWKEVC
jgi:hypothetical protein